MLRYELFLYLSIQLPQLHHHHIHQQFHQRSLLKAGTGSKEFFNSYEKVFDKLNEFNPEFILLSAGFDAHKNDPLANINLESKDYYTLTKEIMKIAKQVCGNKIVSILEGGYNLTAIQESAKYHVEALLEI